MAAMHTLMYENKDLPSLLFKETIYYKAFVCFRI